jgi:uncharacterized protein YyaL (SSP411 family)
MCPTFAEARDAADDVHWTSNVERAALFFLEDSRRFDDTVPLSRRTSRAGLPELAAEYACPFDRGAHSGELTPGPPRIARGTMIVRQVLGLSFDPRLGRLYTTGNDAPSLVVRPHEPHDGTTPAPCSPAAAALTRLGSSSGTREFSYPLRAWSRLSCPAHMDEPLSSRGRHLHHADQAKSSSRTSAGVSRQELCWTGDHTLQRHPASPSKSTGRRIP